MVAEVDDQVRDKIIAAFRKYDAEGKGTISKERLLNVLRAVRGLQPGILMEVEFASLTSEVDKNFEQVIDYAAFIDFVWGAAGQKAEAPPELVPTTVTATAPIASPPSEGQRAATWMPHPLLLAGGGSGVALSMGLMATPVTSQRFLLSSADNKDKCPEKKKKKKKKRVKKPVELTENGVPVLEEAWLRGIFQQCDTSGDQLISKRELIKVSKRSPKVREFFSIPDTGSRKDGRRASNDELTAALDAIFQKVDGDHDRQISWPELLDFYRNRTQASTTTPASATVAMPDGDLSAPEETALRSIYDTAAGGAGKIKKQDAVRAVKSAVDITAFLAYNQSIRQQALEAVTEETMEFLFAAIDGDDEGFMTWIDLQSVYSPKKGAGAAEQEITPGEKAQLDQVFKECDKEGQNRIRKKSFKEMCIKSSSVSAFMGLRHDIDERALEEATRDAMSDLFAGFGGVAGNDDVDISWNQFRDHYKAAGKAAS